VSPLDWFLSAAHSDDDVDAIQQRTDDAITARPR